MSESKHKISHAIEIPTEIEALKVRIEEVAIDIVPSFVQAIVDSQTCDDEDCESCKAIKQEVHATQRATMLRLVYDGFVIYEGKCGRVETERLITLAGKLDRATVEAFVRNAEEAP